MEETKKLTIPDGYEFDRVKGNEVILCNAIRSLCYLICARNVWWKQLGWKPDWNSSDGKWSIYNSNDDVRFGTFVNNNAILAFPTEEVRNQFYGAFKNLIEEAKELL